MAGTSAYFSSMLKLRMLSACRATHSWGAQTSSKHFICNVQPTQQVISLLPGLYPMCHVDPAMQTFSATWLQVFLSHRPIANNPTFEFILDRQECASKRLRISLTSTTQRVSLLEEAWDFLHSKHSSMGASWEPNAPCKTFMGQIPIGW